MSDMSDALCFLSATELQGRIARREVSPVALMRAVLERAARLQPELNCFITLCAEQALDAARAAEQAVMDGKPLGLLHGIPFTAKDLVNTQGVRTTFGAAPYRDNIPGTELALPRLLPPS